MNSRVKALLFALIVVACSWSASTPALARVVGDVGGRRTFEYVVDTNLAGSTGVHGAEVATPVGLVSVDLPQRADHGRPADNEQLQRPDAGDRIAKPIVIVAVIMFVGLALLLLTARVIVRRRAQTADGLNLMTQPPVVPTS